MVPVVSRVATFDVLIIGAGGAGMMCALTAGQRGRTVAILDHSLKVGGKIIISGGGRCNFTNIHATSRNFVSKNEHFCKSALARYQPEDFLEMVRKHKIPHHEKKLGQMFCDGSADAVIRMLKTECDEAGVQFFMRHQINSVSKTEGGKFSIQTDHGEFYANSLVIATGGFSIPKMGATGFGFEVAKKFGLNRVETAPALDGFVFNDADHEKFKGFSGVSLDVAMSCNGIEFHEALLFTHVGLSGPAALQASLHWHSADAVHIDFVPALHRDALFDWFQNLRESKAEIKNILSDLIPRRLAERFCELYWPEGVSIANISRKDLERFCGMLQNWEFVPKSTVGYGKAEVTRGGVDTEELSSKTLEAKKVPGLYFIGEVVDVTGWLGGFNYQWAWASGWAAGQVV